VGFLKTNAKMYKTRDYDGKDAVKAAKAAAPKIKSIPFTQNIYYSAVKIDGPKKKLLEVQAELNFMTEKELIYFESMTKVLNNPAKFATSEVSPEMFNCIKKCMELPKDKAFAGLDLYRMYLTHPNSDTNYSGADAGAEYISHLTAILSGESPKNLNLTALRCLNNLWMQQSAHYVALKRRS